MRTVVRQCNSAADEKTHVVEANPHVDSTLATHVATVTRLYIQYTHRYSAKFKRRGQWGTPSPLAQNDDEADTLSSAFLALQHFWIRHFICLLQSTYVLSEIFPFFNSSSK